MKRKIVLWILRIVLTAALVFATVNIMKIFYDYHTAQNFYDTIRESFAVTLPTDSPSEKQDGVEPDAPSCPIEVDFDALREINPDVVGWIYSPGTEICYPVVQAENNDKYLRHDLYGNYLVSGTVFVDYRCASPEECKNYVIYGHNMDDGSMFASLLGYKKQSYYDEHPVLYYLTPEKNYEIELFVGGVVDMDSVIYESDPEPDELEELLTLLSSVGTFKSDVTASAGDSLVTLSTCMHSYESSKERFIVVGRLVEIK